MRFRVPDIQELAHRRGASPPSAGSRQPLSAARQQPLSAARQQPPLSGARQQPPSAARNEPSASDAKPMCVSQLGFPSPGPSPACRRLVRCSPSSTNSDGDRVNPSPSPGCAVMATGDPQSICFPARATNFSGWDHLYAP